MLVPSQAIEVFTLTFMFEACVDIYFIVDMALNFRTGCPRPPSMPLRCELAQMHCKSSGAVIQVTLAT